MRVLLDCGTTNTECFIVENDGTLIADGLFHFGVKDNGLKDDRVDYKAALRNVVFDTLASKGLKLSDIKGVTGFGMISSDLGLKNIPHSVAPITLQEQQAGVIDYDEDIFGSGIPFNIIRGVRNPLADDSFQSIDNIYSCDFMRGEEPQVVGVMSKYNPEEDFNVITFSSHLKIMNISRDHKLNNILTTMSGQIYDYLINSSIIAKSVVTNSDNERTMTDNEILNLAEDVMQRWGLMRSMLFPRFMDYYTSLTSADRLRFVNAVICLEDMKAIAEYFGTGQYSTKKYYFLGPDAWCSMFALTLLKQHPMAEIEIISGKEKIREISILGALKLIEKHT